MAPLLLRRTLVALIMLALSLAGVGRGLAAADGTGPASIVIGGFVVSLCHTDDGHGRDVPQDGAPHDCCDQCTLRAPADMPTVPSFVPPARIARYAPFETAPFRSPVLARSRTPRCSQGPPSA